MRANPSPTDILQNAHTRARQSQENRQFHQDFLSNFMQNYSINLDNSRLPHQDTPHSPSALNRTPPPRTPLTKTSIPNAMLSTTTAHVKESSPAKNFYELKQKYFDVKPRAHIEVPEPPRTPVSEPIDNKNPGSVFNNVDKMLEKIKKKHESWNLVEDKLVNDIARNRAGSNPLQAPLDDDEVSSLIERVKRKINKTDQQQVPEKENQAQKSGQSTARFEPDFKTISSPPSKDRNPKPSPNKSPNKLVAADIKSQFERALAEADVSPIKPVKDENTNMSMKVSFDNREEEEDEDIIVRRSKGKPPQVVNDSKTTEKVSAGSKVSGSLNQSEHSETVSFNISDSAATGDMRKSNISEKENLSGGSNLTSSQEKPPVAASLSKTRKPEVSRKPEKDESIEKSTPEKPKEKEEPNKDNTNSQSENARTLPRAPVVPPKVVKKEVPEKIVEKKPKFISSFKSKMAQLKDMYAGKTTELLPGESEKPLRPVQPALKQERIENEEKKEEVDELESFSEVKEEKGPKRPEILVMDNQNYDSPQKDSAKHSGGGEFGTSFDNIMSYTKLTDEKMEGIEDTQTKIRDEAHPAHQNFLDHPISGMSPVPKKHLDFERASEISFNVSPEESLMYPELEKVKEPVHPKKVIHPQQVINKPVQFEWNEQLEREFEAYCNRDPEIMKLRSKINYLQGEIALASM